MKIRDAGRLDLDTSVDFLLAMLDGMVSVGGHPLAERQQVSAWLRDRMASAIDDPDHLLLLAESAAPESQPTGIIEASITQLHAVFAPRRVLHIHAIYVLPDHRRQGIAQGLMAAALDWGAQRECDQVALNTLVGNPARELFESMGFRVFELEMRKSL